MQLQPPNATSTTTSTTTTSTTTTGPPPGTTTNLTLNNLAHLNATNFAVTVGQATANLLLSDSDTKVLQNPSIRATDGQKADLKIGERIPVATGSYQTGAATAVVSSLVNTQFTYLDVGVEIEITPIVHYDRDVTLKIKLVSSQESGSTNIGGITEPIISQTHGRAGGPPQGRRSQHTGRIPAEAGSHHHWRNAVSGRASDPEVHLQLHPA